MAALLKKAAQGAGHPEATPCRTLLSRAGHHREQGATSRITTWCRPRCCSSEQGGRPSMWRSCPTPRCSTSTSAAASAASCSRRSARPRPWPTVPAPATPRRRSKEDAHYVRAFIGTQADKLNDAVDAMLVLMNDMPMATRAVRRRQDQRPEGHRQHPHHQGEHLLDLGCRATPWAWTMMSRKLTYERIPAITIEDMKAFFDKEIKGRHLPLLRHRQRESAMDLKVLEKLGPVTRLDQGSSCSAIQRNRTEGANFAARNAVGAPCPRTPSP